LETPKKELKTFQPWEVRVIINRSDPDSKTGERKDFEETPPGSSHQDGLGAAAVLKIFVYDTKNEADGLENHSVLEIYNTDLQALLKRLLAHHPTHDFYGEIMTVKSPFEPLIMNWDLLVRESSKNSDQESEKVARKALGTLLNLLQQNNGDSQLKEYFLTRDSLRGSKSITFQTLWTIFAPGTIIYGRPCLKKDQLFIVQDNLGAWPEAQIKEWGLACWTYDWDGHIFRRRSIALSIPRFSGSKPILALPYYPLSAANDREQIQEELIRRGKKYRKYCLARTDERRYRYHGTAIVDKVGFRGSHKVRPISKTILIDH
jgi:hypothetical protein